MCKKHEPIVLHEFSGSWREIGRQYGEDCRKEIQDMVEYWRKALAPVLPGKAWKKSLPLPASLQIQSVHMHLTFTMKSKESQKVQTVL